MQQAEAENGLESIVRVDGLLSMGEPSTTARKRRHRQAAIPRELRAEVMQYARNLARRYGDLFAADRQLKDRPCCPAFQLPRQEQGQGWAHRLLVNNTSRIDATTSSGS
jgi:hypothetical protein